MAENFPEVYLAIVLPPVTTADPSWYKEVIEFLRNDQKVNALKLIRTSTSSTGWREAKDVADFACGHSVTIPSTLKGLATRLRELHQQYGISPSWDSLLLPGGGHTGRREHSVCANGSYQERSRGDCGVPDTIRTVSPQPWTLFAVICTLSRIGCNTWLATAKEKKRANNPFLYPIPLRGLR